MIVTYIDSVAGHRDEGGLRWGVESICAQLTELGAKIAPATYYEHRGRKPTAREVSDADLKPKVATIHAANYGVYGARKVWLTLNRERPSDALPIARCTVERLMREMGLQGAVRGKVKRTTISDPKTPKPLDLVDRNFRPLAPGRALGCGLHLLLDMVGLVLHRVRHRRLRPANPGLVGVDHDDQPVRRRRGRPSDLDPRP